MKRLTDEDLIAIEARASEASHNSIAFGVFALMPIVQDDLPRLLADLRHYKAALDWIHVEAQDLSECINAAQEALVNERVDTPHGKAPWLSEEEEP